MFTPKCNKQAQTHFLYIWGGILTMNYGNLLKNVIHCFFLSDSAWNILSEMELGNTGYEKQDIIGAL